MITIIRRDLSTMLETDSNSWLEINY